MPIRPGDHVLDAGAGTGFATAAAAVRVGLHGRVLGVDISEGMLDYSRAAIAAAGLHTVDLVNGDACDLRDVASGSFDHVVSAAALLYMPVSRALAEWYRLLKPGGTLGFSTMRAGFPLAGTLFRECAAEFGVRLTDPSATLGSESKASGALARSGFTSTTVLTAHVALDGVDSADAWESNLRSAGHERVHDLSRADLETLRQRFERGLDARRRVGPSFDVAEVLYAYGTKPARAVSGDAGLPRARK